MDQQKFFEAVGVLDNYADMLCRRVRNDLGEAEDAVDEAFKRALAFEAIFCVDSLLAKAHRDAHDSPAFATRIEHPGHGDAAA